MHFFSIGARNSRRTEKMSDNKGGFLNDQLSKRTSIFGLRLWVVVGICVGAGIVIVLFFISLWFTSKRNNNNSNSKNASKNGQDNSSTNVCSSQKPTIPNFSREITEIQIEKNSQDPKPHRVLGTDPIPESDPINVSDQRPVIWSSNEETPIGHQRIHIEIGKDHRISYPERGTGSSSNCSGEGGRSGEQMGMAVPEVSHLGWGHWYTLRELEVSTNGFADENVIGEGGYGIVYRGVLGDNTQVAVKNLLNNRMLVYEYVNNGNLEQWLHGDVGSCSPLTWDIRMNIIIGTAKGLTYLHEGLEPKVVHRDIKSSNILLDKQWNSKVSDFGLAKLLGSERNYVTTRVMGTFGYVAPEYASTGMLNERSDVYSFGILLMEIISGRNPVDYSRPPGEVNLVDWLKTMVSNQNAEGVLDPKLPEKPSSRALKRALLVALRCVDPNAQKRPKMGHIVHMLEADEFPYRDDRRGGRDHGRTHRYGMSERSTEKQMIESGDSSGCESGAPVPRLPWRKEEHEQQQ
ncbi:hypothetical protein Ancab_016397 [Ancistrocladus abbreviatus]